MEAFHDHDQGNQDKNIEFGKINAQRRYESEKNNAVHFSWICFGHIPHFGHNYHAVHRCRPGFAVESPGYSGSELYSLPFAARYAGALLQRRQLVIQTAGRAIDQYRFDRFT